MSMATGKRPLGRRQPSMSVTRIDLPRSADSPFSEGLTPVLDNTWDAFPGERCAPFYADEPRLPTLVPASPFPTPLRAEAACLDRNPQPTAPSDDRPRPLHLRAPLPNMNDGHTHHAPTPDDSGRLQSGGSTTVTPERPDVGAILTLAHTPLHDLAPRSSLALRLLSPPSALSSVVSTLSFPHSKEVALPRAANGPKTHL